MKKQTLSFFLFLCLVISSLAGQSNGGTVFGEIIEASTEEALEFVNLALYKDTSFISGTISNKEGLFSFSDLPVGDYHISLSFVGFETKKTDIFSIESEGQELDLDEISLQISAEVLDIVVVTEEKAIYNLDIDRKVYNVEKDILASTSSATEILQNIPSVSVDVDGQISLRGSSNITYFINGKPSAMMRMNSTSALQQIPANMIERIEVITNPSAKYKPDGIGGIINIVLKENTGNGLNGTVMANIGNLDRYNGSLSLSYGQEDINAYASYGIRHSDTPRDDIENIINKDGNGGILSTFDKNINAKYNEFSHLVNAGMEWELNDSDFLSISGNYFLTNNQNPKKISSIFNDPFEPSQNESNTTNLILDEKEQAHELGIAFEHQFEEDHALAFEYVYANFHETEDGYFNESHTLPTLRDSFIHNLIEIKGPTHEITLEYALPIGEDTEFEMGYVAELMKESHKYIGEFKPTQETNWINDPNRSNHFIFTQNIHALYATFGHAIGDFGFLAGLRAEQAYVTSNLVSRNETTPNDYFKLYPTLHLSYELNDNQQIQLSYSKRVNRADSDEQNPFEEYVDNYTVDVGNPNLLPEQVHSVEFGYRLQADNFTFLPSIYYRYKKDAFTEILETVNTNITKTTFTNLDTDQSTGLEFIFSGKAYRNLNFNLSSNLFYQQIDARNLGFSKNKSAFSWDSRLGLNFNITKSTYAQINAYYRSNRITPQGEFDPIVLFNVGLRQSILKNQASIVLTVSDIFRTLDYESSIDTPILNQRTRYGRNSQIVYLGFIYPFGKNIRNQKKKLGFEDALEAGKQVSEK